MRERWPNERRSAAPNQRWLLRSSRFFLAMTSHTLLLEFAHVSALLGSVTASGQEAAGRPSQVGALLRFTRLILPAATTDLRIARMASRSPARGQLSYRLSFHRLAGSCLERLPRVE